VARLAGLPSALLERAKSVLDGLLAQHNSPSKDLLDELLQLDLSQTTPLEALVFLQRLQARLLGRLETAKP
jgi:DNA mismatch repair protein MutS